jgi:CHASE2 domain-containing sensor protein
MAKTRKRRRRRSGPPPAPPKQRKPVEPAARRTARDERPQAPWGSFPLTELTILIGLVLLVAGFAGGSIRGTLMIAVGIGLAALGGLELAVREHFAGYRSHSGLLALACGVAAGAAVGGAVALLFGSILAVVPVAVGLLVFVPALLAFRGAFRRASGGLSFRIGRLHG